MAPTQVQLSAVEGIDWSHSWTTMNRSPYTIILSPSSTPVALAPCLECNCTLPYWVSSLSSVCSDQQRQTLELGNEQEPVDHYRPASINKHKTQVIQDASSDLDREIVPNAQTVRVRKSIGCLQELGPAVPADIDLKGYQAGDR